MVSREEAFAKDIGPREGRGRHPDLHGGGSRGAVLAAALDGVAPDGEEGEPFEGGLAALAEGDGLAAMVGAGVAEQEIGEVDGEERVAACAAQRGGGDVVADACAELGASAHASQGAAVGGVIVGVELERAGGEVAGQDRGEKRVDARFYGFRIGPAELALEERPASALVGAHGALAAQGAVGEVVEEPGVCADGEVGVEGEELGELEGLEAVDDEGFAQGVAAEERGVKEEAVAAEACDEADDGRVRGMERAGDLSQRSALGDEGGDGEREVSMSEPVGVGEGLGGEAPVAVGAAEGLDAPLVGWPAEEAEADEAPLRVRAMEAAARVGAAGGLKAPATPDGMSTQGSHAPRRSARRAARGWKAPKVNKKGLVN